MATLFHYGKLADTDVGQIAVALAGYGAGLLGLVAIKVLAPGYASQDVRTRSRLPSWCWSSPRSSTPCWCRSSTTLGWPCRLAWGSGQRAVAVDRAGAARRLPAPAGLVALCVAGGGGQCLAGGAAGLGLALLSTGWPCAPTAASGCCCCWVDGGGCRGVFRCPVGCRGSSCGRCCAAERSLHAAQWR